MVAEYFWFFIVGLTSAVTAILIKYYLITNNIYYIILALLVGPTITLSSIYAFSYGNVGTIYPILRLISVIIVFIAGIYLFAEKYTIMNFVGLGLAGGAIYLLSV
jgi:multidrug transporter EmrE-like cation transporter